MTARGVRLALILLLPLLGCLYAWQRSSTGQRRSQAYEWEMQSPAGEDPPHAWIEAEFAFARLRYRSFRGGGGFGFRGRRGGGSWGTDSNTAERHLMRG